MLWEKTRGCLLEKKGKQGRREEGEREFEGRGERRLRFPVFSLRGRGFRSTSRNRISSFDLDRYQVTDSGSNLSLWVTVRHRIGSDWTRRLSKRSLGLCAPSYRRTSKQESVLDFSLWRRSEKKKKNSLFHAACSLLLQPSPSSSPPSFKVGDRSFDGFDGDLGRRLVGGASRPGREERRSREKAKERLGSGSGGPERFAGDWNQKTVPLYTSAHGPSPLPRMPRYIAGVHDVAPGSMERLGRPVWCLEEPSGIRHLPLRRCRLLSPSDVALLRRVDFFGFVLFLLLLFAILNSPEIEWMML